MLVALAAALTLVPALLTHYADNLGRAPRQVADEGFFGRLARRVQRRPLLVAVGTAAILLAAAGPFLTVNLGNGDPRVLPRSAESRQVADRLLTGFPGREANPLIVVGSVPAAKPAVATYANRVSAVSATGRSVYGLAWLAGAAVIGVLYDVSIDAAIAFTVAVQAVALVLSCRCSGQATNGEG